MATDAQLSEIFDRGIRNGIDTLSPPEKELFLIQDFIIEYEMNGLSGYLYNRLPDVAGIDRTVQSMKKHGLAELASILSEVLKLFAQYRESIDETTWQQVEGKYDPTHKLDALAQQISALPDYGLSRD